MRGKSLKFAGGAVIGMAAACMFSGMDAAVAQAAYGVTYNEGGNHLEDLWGMKCLDGWDSIPMTIIILERSTVLRHRTTGITEIRQGIVRERTDRQIYREAL